MITFFVVATRQYTSYALSLAASMQEYVRSGFELCVFTDDPDAFVSLEQTLTLGTAKIVCIESLGWPHAALARHDLIATHIDQCSGKIVCYLDADTVFRSMTAYEDFEIELKTTQPIATVLHPGYFRRSLLFRALEHLPTGPWERNKQSSAFVPRVHRRNYVCSGVFFGERLAIKKMCEEVRELITKDQQIGYVAKWHDESYLNAWIAEKDIRRLPPEWAFAEGYPNLEGITPRIEVIHKPANWVRER